MEPPSSLTPLPPLLDTRRVRHSTPTQLRDYYRELINKVDERNITEELLRAIERGSVATNAFQLWLGVSTSPPIILRGLEQTFSVLVRRHAIKVFGKVLRSSRWAEMWLGLGGVQGLMKVLADLSVDEVREACKVVGKCAKEGDNDLEEKRKCITELFLALQPSLYSDLGMDPGSEPEVLF